MEGKVTRSAHLSDDELAVLELLGACATAHSDLPAHHPADQGEFTAAIHAAQNIILARPAYAGLYYVPEAK